MHLDFAALHLGRGLRPMCGKQKMPLCVQAPNGHFLFFTRMAHGNREKYLTGGTIVAKMSLVALKSVVFCTENAF